MLDLGKLATLKQHLLEATDFFDVYGYFMEHFGHRPELMTLGEPLDDATFVAVLEQIGARIVGEEGSITEPFLLRLREHQLVHGAFVLGTHVGTVFYFSDVDTGLAAFGAMDSEGPSQLARFSLAKVPVGTSPTLH
jgi:hypothetical protein